MIDAIVMLVRRLCVCGLLSGVALTLVKDSGHEAIMRLCCASLLVVVLFTSLPGMRLTAPELPQRDALQRQADEAVAQAAQDQCSAVCQGAEAYITSQAKAQGIECTVRVEGNLAPDNAFAVERVTIVGALGSGQQQALRQLAREALGVEDEQVAFTGEGTDETE